MDQPQAYYFRIKSFCGRSANSSSVLKALNRSEVFGHYPPELAQAMLAFHRKYPPLFRRSRPSSAKPCGVLPAWIRALIHEKAPDTVAVIPKQLEHLPLLYGSAILIELAKLQYDEVIYPQHGESYFEATGLEESAWRKELGTLRHQWPELDAEDLEWCRVKPPAWSYEESLPLGQTDQVTQRKQQKALEKIEDLREHLQTWRGKTAPEMEPLSEARLWPIRLLTRPPGSRAQMLPAEIASTRPQA
jgi:hypothetical protein